MNLNIFLLFISLALFIASPILAAPEPCRGRSISGIMKSLDELEKAINRTGKNYRTLSFDTFSFD